MVRDVNRFNAHEYKVIDDEITYKEHDGYTSTTSYGYEILFAYYNEKENGKITEGNLEKYVCINVGCGNFSYAEIPHKFNYIMGVTGTLETLEPYEKNIIENEYNIKINTAFSRQ
ncbi:unnamed protein product [Blepharisma stoltei]|uniref:Uncharacterized protein n=1 Tax=Blepharisma stoltei TaxID=1481888 RepID=A0AAU9J5M1_9CILI|nr:unnamed protein product [Blepharisma stoltei]